MKTIQKTLQDVEEIEIKEVYVSGDLINIQAAQKIEQEMGILSGSQRKFEGGTLYLSTIARSQVFIIDKLQNLQATVDAGICQQSQDHAQILAHSQRTEALLEQTRKENLHLQELLSKKYPAERMGFIAGTILFACCLSLLATIFLKFQIIHPILAVIGILSSALFLAMSYWRRIIED